MTIREISNSYFVKSGGITFRGRVVLKSGTKNWSNSKGNGRLSSVIVLDDENEIMGCKMFTNEHDRFHNLLKVGKVYDFINVSVAAPFMRTKTSNCFEATLRPSSSVVEVFSGVEHIPMIRKNKRQNLIDIWRSKDTESISDYLVVVRKVGDLLPFSRKNGSGIGHRRTLQVVDSSGVIVDVTLWDDVATRYKTCAFVVGDVVVIHDMVINTWKGLKGLSSTPLATITFNPQVTGALELKEWYGGLVKSDLVGLKEMIRNEATLTRGRFEDWSVFGDEYQFIRNEELNFDGDGHLMGDPWLKVSGLVLHICFGGITCGRPPWYDACPRVISDDGRICRKKLGGGDGCWRCDRCEVPVDTPRCEWMVEVNIADDNITRCVMLLGEKGEIALGMKASEARDLANAGGCALELRANEALFRRVNLLMRPKVVDLWCRMVAPKIIYEVAKVDTRTDYVMYNRIAASEIEYLRGLNAHIPPPDPPRRQQQQAHAVQGQQKQECDEPIDSQQEEQQQQSPSQQSMQQRDKPKRPSMYRRKKKVVTMVALPPVAVMTADSAGPVVHEQLVQTQTPNPAVQQQKKKPASLYMRKKKLQVPSAVDSGSAMSDEITTASDQSNTADDATGPVDVLALERMSSNLRLFFGE